MKQKVPSVDTGVMQHPRAVPDACLLQGPDNMLQMFFVRCGLLLHVDKIQNNLPLSLEAIFGFSKLIIGGEFLGFLLNFFWLVNFSVAFLV